MVLSFTVYGVAEQMGSKRALIPKGWKRPIVTDTNRNLKAWQALVASSAQQAIQQLHPAVRQLITDGVRLMVTFYLPRPKSLPKRRQAHVARPDLDKLVRAVGDALTGIAYADDSQIVDVLALKRYTTGIPRIDVQVEPTAGILDFGIVPIEAPRAMRRS